MKSRKRHASSSEDSADSAESDDSSSEESSGSEDSYSEGEQRRHKKHKKRADDSSDDGHKKKKKRKHKKKKKKHGKKKNRDEEELSSASEREERERSKLRHPRRDSLSSLSLEPPPAPHIKRSESRDASRSPQPTRYYESYKRDSRRRSHSPSPERRRRSRSPSPERSRRSRSPFQERRHHDDFYLGSSRDRSYRSASRHDTYRKDSYKDEPYRKEDYKSEPYRKDDYYKKEEYYKKDHYYKKDSYYKKDDYYRKDSYRKDDYYKNDEYYKKDDYKQSHYEDPDYHERYQHRKYGQEDYRNRQYNNRGGYSNGRQGYDVGEGSSRGPPPHHRQHKDFYEEDRPVKRDRDELGPARGGTAPGQQKEEPSRSQSERAEKRPLKRERDGVPPRERKSRFGKEDEGDYTWGKPDVKKEEGGGPAEKDKPNFGLSGKLAADVNTVNGIQLKYSEPDDAKQPKRRWRFYPFKGDKALPILYIHRQSCFVLGREHRVVDIPLEHPSISKQHAALQYRATPFTRPDGTQGRRVRPYIIDLDSANGTFVNNKKIEARRFVELFERDVVKFGFSQREYVLLHENSKDDAADDDQEMGGAPQIGDAVTSIATIKREKQIKQERAHDDE